MSSIKEIKRPQKEVLQNYHKMLFEEEFKKKNGEYIPKKNIHTSDFIGPGLVTLDVINIGQLNPDESYHLSITNQIPLI